MQQPINFSLTIRIKTSYSLPISMNIFVTILTLLQVHKRAAAPACPIRDGDVVDPLRRVLGVARLHRPAPVLYRAVGPRGVAASSPHLLQPPRPASLPHTTTTTRETTPGRRRNQHFRHRINFQVIIRLV